MRSGGELQRWTPAFGAGVDVAVWTSGGLIQITVAPRLLASSITLR
jgi:hypothetical protein